MDKDTRYSLLGLACLAAALAGAFLVYQASAQSPGQAVRGCLEGEFGSLPEAPVTVEQQ